MKLNRVHTIVKSVINETVVWSCELITRLLNWLISTRSKKNIHFNGLKLSYTVNWGCFEVKEWLKIIYFSSMWTIMQTPLKINKTSFCDIKHGLTITSDIWKIKYRWHERFLAAEELWKNFKKWLFFIMKNPELNNLQMSAASIISHFIK